MARVGADIRLGSSTHLTNIAMRVPGLLEESDWICANGKDASKDSVTKCAKALLAIESELHSWVTNWYSTLVAGPVGS